MGELELGHSEEDEEWEEQYINGNRHRKSSIKKTCNFIEKETLSGRGVFLWICEIFKNTLNTLMWEYNLITNNNNQKLC